MMSCRCYGVMPQLAPDIAAVQYRFGLCIYLVGEMDEALRQIEKAVELDPEVSEFRQARDLLKQKLDQEQQAIE